MANSIGVLLVNLGSPDTPERGDVGRYLNEFLTDERVIDIPWLQRQLLVRGIITPTRSANTSRSYREIWTSAGSPLKCISESLATKVQAALDNIAHSANIAHSEPQYYVALAMRYQTPDIASALESLRKKGVQKYLILPLYPQYSSACNGSVMQRCMEIFCRWQVIPEVQMISQFYTDEGFLNAFAAIGQQYNPQQYDHVLFSFHGLPQRQLEKADDHNHCLKSPNCCQAITERNQFCYSAQCYDTARLIAQKLHLPHSSYSVSFQSRLGRDPWTQPYTINTIAELAKQGKKRILVFCPAFVADCLETLFEISKEYQDEFIHLGGEKLQLVESLNDHPLWIEAVANLIRRC